MKTLKVFKFFTLAAVLAMPLVSCSDDDGPNGGDAAPAPEVDGSRLTSINGYTFSYDSKGRLSTVTSGSSSASQSLKIDYDKGTITETDYDGETSVYNVKFCEKGYIAQLSASWNYEEKEGSDRYQYVGNGVINFAYDGNGNLTAISSSTNETYKDLTEGETSTSKQEYTLNYTWKEGNMISAVENSTEVEDGETDKWKETYEVTYGTTANKFLQNTMAITNIGMEDAEEVLAMAGLFGKGTAKLPASVKETEDGENPYTHTTNYSYQLNENGSIAEEQGDGYSYVYGYTKTRAAFEGAVKPLSLRSSFFRKAGK